LFGPADAAEGLAEVLDDPAAPLVDLAIKASQQSFYLEWFQGVVGHGFPELILIGSIDDRIPCSATGLIEVYELCGKNTILKVKIYRLKTCFSS